MEESLSSKFTKRIIGYHASFELYEYCPQDENDFRQFVQAIISSNRNHKDSLRVSAINKLINKADLDIQPLAVNSSIQKWVDVYWQLYCKNYVNIGYTTKMRLGPRIVLTRGIEGITMQ